MSLIRCARSLEELAANLVEQHVAPQSAIDSILEAAGDNLMALRRAHRHHRQLIIDEWPAPDSVTRAFFLLSAARIKAEKDQR